MYQIAVCDDEPAIRAQVIRILDAHPSRNKFHMLEFSSGEALTIPVGKQVRALIFRRVPRDGNLD